MYTDIRLYAGPEMRVELEIRRGRVEPIAQTIEVSGTDNSVSSATVTTFELDGAVVEYRGGILPFRAGDEAIVAGSPGRDGMFQAYAVQLPRQGVTVGGSSALWLLFGAVFIAAGCIAFIAMGGTVFSMDADDWPFPAALALILWAATIVFPVAGLAVIRQSRRATRARAMLDSPNMRRAPARPAGL